MTSALPRAAWSPMRKPEAGVCTLETESFHPRSGAVPHAGPCQQADGSAMEGGGGVSTQDGWRFCPGSCRVCWKPAMMSELKQGRLELLRRTEAHLSFFSSPLYSQATRCLRLGLCKGVELLSQFHQLLLTKFLKLAGNHYKHIIKQVWALLTGQSCVLISGRLLSWFELGFQGRFSWQQA